MDSHEYLKYIGFEHQNIDGVDTFTLPISNSVRFKILYSDGFYYNEMDDKLSFDIIIKSLSKYNKRYNMNVSVESYKLFKRLKTIERVIGSV